MLAMPQALHPAPNKQSLGYFVISLPTFQK